MKVEFDVEKGKEDGSAAVGCSWLFGGLLWMVAALVASVGVGIMFGAAWGFLLYAALLVLTGMAIVWYVKRMAAKMVEALDVLADSLDEMEAALEMEAGDGKDA